MSSSKSLGRDKKSKDQKTPWSVNTKGAFRWLERLALIVEQPINRITGSLKLNIFYHTDTIAVYLWFIVALTGTYITLFYQFGFEGSYNAVAKIESQFVARTIRAIHRYVSGSAVIVTLLHAYRTFFMDRFRGARWLAWVSGIGMGVFLWLDAITGYWLIWDQRAQILNNTFITFLNRYFGTSGDSFALALIEANQVDSSWAVMFWFLTAHILLFGVAALFFWYHIVRLNKPKLFPPKHWMISTGLVMVIASALFPLGMLPRASFEVLPGKIELDPFFLFYFPAELNGAIANTFWISILSITLVLLTIPWIIRRRKPAPVKVIDDACIGCTLCAIDCPYKALEMIERKNGSGSKMIALAHPNMCVSCGICIGSCAYDAIEVGELNAKAMWEATNLLLAQAKEKAPEEQVKVVFTCERHAAHGARPYLETEASLKASEPRLITIPLPCVGAAPPDLIGNTYKAGASEVQMIGCPPDD
ncbi:MAG: 4Fe-4S dicluster domain-containing protein, partial [Anaerolineae bacterium]|nr:4Fe-4S dicluster domain-containing protein [Anaerolineae bacterium]